MDRKKSQKGQFLKKNKNTGLFVYIATIIFSILFLFFGNKFATQGLTIFNSEDSNETIMEASVEKIVDKTSSEYTYGNSSTFETIEITFEAIVLDGVEKGETVTGIQFIDSAYNAQTPEVKEGNKIFLLNYEGEDAIKWQFMEFVRTDKLFVFGIFFILALLFFGRMKGFNTILSLVFTCGGIFAVFIPSILSGKNIYISAIIICLYTIVMTFLLINKVNKKTFGATLGCFGGLFVAGILTIIMDKVLMLTGYLTDESTYLTYISAETPINLKAIIFAAILIGSMGAIMDVSMSISSSLWEVKDKARSCSFAVLLKSGMNIGRDIMGTMANTLVLAYIGSSLSVVLLLTAYSTSLTSLLSREMIIVEILQALIGSFGILFTMPLTSFICAIIYTKNKSCVPLPENCHVDPNSIDEN